MGSQIVLREVYGVRVVAIYGKFDVTNASEVADALEHAAVGRDALVVSLERCDHLDIEGVAALMFLHRRLGCGFVIVCGTQRPFEITGVDKHIRVEKTIEDALRYLS